LPKAATTAFIVAICAGVRSDSSSAPRAETPIEFWLLIGLTLPLPLVPGTLMLPLALLPVRLPLPAPTCGDATLSGCIW